MKRATFAAGCFWGVEEAFRQIEGIHAATVGYAGGHTTDPTYREVCSGDTGHAEAVQVEYDPDVVSYDQLLEAFGDLHDPTRPGHKDQYRSAIFFHDPAQEAAAQAWRQRVDARSRHSRSAATEISAASTFYRAEEYHQRYTQKAAARRSRSPGE